MNSNQRIVLAPTPIKNVNEVQVIRPTSFHLKWGIKDFQNMVWHKFQIQSVETLNYHDTMEYKWCAIQKTQ